MAINITITGLTPEQAQDVGNAFDAISGRMGDDGQPLYTKARWVEIQLLRFIKNVVKGWKRKAHEDAIASEQSQVDSDFVEN